MVLREKVIQLSIVREKRSLLLRNKEYGVLDIIIEH